jgi:glycosyltransferase involved in cell wall biosynthesis
MGMAAALPVIPEHAMKVLLLTRFSRKGASSRMRSLQYVDALTAMGVELTVSSLLGDDYLDAIFNGRKASPALLLRAYAERAWQLLRAGRYDLVWFEKELFPDLPSLFEFLLAWRGIPYVVDYDDAIFHNYALSGNPYKRLMKNKIAAVMRRAALVIGGNHYLLGHAREAGAARTALLPTVIDIERYRPAVRDDSGPMVIGWIGSPNTSKYLQVLLPVLDRLAQRFPLELVVVGAVVDTHDRPYLRCVRWQEETEVEQIARFDIGIMPLPDGPWERGKCGYKLIQYMACEKPVIASPVGVNTDIVRHGSNGLLARTAAEWQEALTALLQDADLRRELGRQGRLLVEQQYCLQVTAPRLYRLLQSVARPGQTMDGRTADSRNAEVR